MSHRTRAEAMHRKQEAYIRAIAAGESSNAAAEAAGVTRYSVIHWRKDPIFAEVEADTMARAQDALAQKRRKRLRLAAGEVLRDAPPRRT